MLRRTQDALGAMQRLERHRGHFFNWYDTRTLKPLLPLYVSSVDSGNLAGHLLTLGPGLAELQAQPILTPQVFAGLSDTVGILRELAGKSAELEQLEAELAQPPATLRAGFDLLQRATDRAAALAAALDEGAGEELKWWTQALERNCREHLEDLLFLAPWLTLAPDSAPRGRCHRVGQSPLRSSPNSTRRPLCARCQNWSNRSVHCSRRRCKPSPWNLPHPGSQRRKRALPNGCAACGKPAVAPASASSLWKPWPGKATNWPRWTSAFCSIPRAISSPSASTSPNAALDTSFYDLLASEARLCSYVAIALGQVSQDHWFSLGRLLVASRGEPILVSWSGSMFEYLMPLLVMPNYENTLLDHTCKAAVQQQIEYGQLRGVPWGISESGYNRTDVQLNYQYRAFGVPGLGLKRGLAEDLVIAPYATAMALMVAPREACDNLATARRRRTRRRLRVLRGGGLYAVAPAAGRVQRHHPLLHGASSRHEPARPGVSVAGPSHATALPVVPRCSKRRTCSCRSACPRPPRRCSPKI